MSYVIVVLETESDFPGVDVVFGDTEGRPFETMEEASKERARAVRLALADSYDHVQIASLAAIRDPL